MLDGSVGGRTVVMGGSISGMLAARVLADFFDEVIIVEADDPSYDKNARKRVPQGQHSHVLLQAGQQVLERLFPNLINELIEDGSVVADFTNDLEWFHFGQWNNQGGYFDLDGQLPCKNPLRTLGYSAEDATERGG